MAKDDYDVIVCRVLVYLYACLKRKTVFEGIVFEKIIKEKAGNEDYFDDVLRKMQAEGLIEGLTFKKVWGGAYIRVSDYSDAEITPEGIHYLSENDKMKQALRCAFEVGELIIKLAGMIHLIP